MPKRDAVVLDTHALLWWQAASNRLSRAARQRIERSDAVLLSPISCWEIAMLVEKERVLLDRPVSVWINDLLATSITEIADLTPMIAVAAGQLNDFHGDPADRIIYATAAAHQLPLVSKDNRLRTFAKADRNVAVVW